ncbi:MAG: hypothetical protein KKA81_12470 [Bacteroidetes bacterium]|nr:hypothetical protein [Bacteroidota bacterium]
MESRHNKILLDSLYESYSWQHYKKNKPIWAKKLKQPQKIKTLEGEITCHAGDYLCKGPAGDIWGQKEESLLKKYNPAYGSEPDKGGWQEFIPKPEAGGVMAAQVEFDFVIEHPTWGNMKGKSGDYLVKNYEDKDSQYPDDMWIVRNEIFKCTYELVNP